jgi:ABC-2 type transport system ATP-binding protein
MGRESELLVMDEPAAILDPEARHIFFQLLAEKQKTAAMLISSHRLDEVATLVNRVIEMDQGKVVLDDRVADLVELSSRLNCRIRLVQAEEAFSKAIAEWGFKGTGDGLVWEGSIAGPDRLRFLGMISRYAALLTSIGMDEATTPEEAAVGVR